MLGPLIIGLTIGLMGGFHCVAMCGPVASFLHSKSGTNLTMVMYNTGRLVTYVALGLIVGLVGQGIYIANWQSGVSIVSGVVIILLIVIPGLSKKLSAGSSTNIIVSKLRKRLVNLSENKSHGTYLSLGVLNGLLPCGLVYMALIASLNGGGLLESTVLMLGFGLGTWPLMSIVMMGSGLLNKQVFFKRLVPSISVIVGILLIVRGLSLDIPYLSPLLSSISLDFGMTNCATP